MQYLVLPSEKMVPTYIFAPIIDLCIDDAGNRSASVDLNTNGETDQYQDIYNIVTMGGKISW